jgi:tRNA G26 N,N-dimethylase Trm1
MNTPMINCPACGHHKPHNFASSRYTHAPICDDCARREAFEGPFWDGAAQAWAIATEAGNRQPKDSNLWIVRGGRNWRK